jgi:7-cyano-7-deazaguanine reductase
MKSLEVMPNLMQSVHTLQCHAIALGSACPVSGNPKQGSTLKISYCPDKWHLEVYSLRAFVDQFNGGLTYPNMAPGEYAVRDQEHMIQYVAQSCADAVGVEVTATADLILIDGVSTSSMMIECWAKPSGDSKAIISRFAK